MASASCQPESIQLVTTAAATSRPNPLASLPDLCLLALFEQLPLLDQLTTRQTCARWNILLRQLTQTRRTLAIRLHHNFYAWNYTADSIDYKDRSAWFHSWYYPGAISIISQLQKDDGSPLFPCRLLTAWNRLSVISLPATLNEQICTTFSRIKKLELQVYFNEIPDERYLVSLVEQLGPRLETFHLNMSLTLLLEPMLADRLFAAINSMSSLLYLNIHLNESIPPYDLPIISHLEELHFHWDSTTPDQFAEMLHQYGEGNGALRRIEYRSHQPLQLAPFNRLSRRLRHCFTSFVFFPPSDIDKLSLCDHFHSLTSFELYHNFTISIRRLFAQLSQLTQLTLLNLVLYFIRQLPDSEASHRQPPPLPQLPSVVMLQVRPFFRSHRDLDQLAIPWTMPNLQVIGFDFQPNFKICTDCIVTHSSYFATSNKLEPFKECARQFFRPLMAQCGRLRLIRHNRENTIGTAEKLLALDQSRPAEEF